MQATWMFELGHHQSTTTFNNNLQQQPRLDASCLDVSIKCSQITSNLVFMLTAWTFKSSHQ